MGYYMRYLFEGQPEIRLEDVEAALKKVDADYALQEWSNENRSAEIWYQGEIYAEIDLEILNSAASNPSGLSATSPSQGRSLESLSEEELDEEIEEMIEEVESIRGFFIKKPKQRVLDFLKTVKARIIVRVLWGGREGNSTLEKLDPLWEWLTANYKGMLQADGEGFYEGRKLILKME